MLRVPHYDKLRRRKSAASHGFLSCCGCRITRRTGFASGGRADRQTLCLLGQPPGSPPAPTTETQTVYVPRRIVLSPQRAHRIMARFSRMEVIRYVRVTASRSIDPTGHARALIARMPKAWAGSRVEGINGRDRRSTPALIPASLSSSSRWMSSSTTMRTRRGDPASWPSSRNGRRTRSSTIFSCPPRTFSSSARSAPTPRPATSRWITPSA